MTDMDREWVESMAGHPVTDAEAIQFLADFNDWLDQYHGFNPDKLRPSRKDFT